ncbi:hypothetical protein DF947_10655 [Pedobacter paludis]|uniref:Uncharacterized protein n=2 Tax=Pedobacter paludis TaxID=2203212 RepID=A0A317EZ16_9SPHI|nr:hypothetical protein DF947_10655 [Pedobacter paludis]
MKVPPPTPLSNESLHVRSGNRMIRIPESYLLFCAELGAGSLLDRFKIFLPKTDPADPDGLQAQTNLLKSVLIEDLYFPQNEAEENLIIANALPFSYSLQGEYLFWNSATENQGEFPVYLANVFRTPVLLSSDFHDFILSISHETRWPDILGKIPTKLFISEHGELKPDHRKDGQQRQHLCAQLPYSILMAYSLLMMERLLEFSRSSFGLLGRTEIYKGLQEAVGYYDSLAPNYRPKDYPASDRNRKNAFMLMDKIYRLRKKDQPYQVAIGVISAMEAFFDFAKTHDRIYMEVFSQRVCTILPTDTPLFFIDEINGDLESQQIGYLLTQRQQLLDLTPN